MNVTLSLEDDLVSKERKLAVDRDTTLNAMIRAYLEDLVGEESEMRRRRALEALDRSFLELSFPRGGPRTWTRADLYERF